MVRPFDRCLATLAGLTEVAVDRDMGRDCSISQFVHELHDIIGLVPTQRDPLASPALPVDQLQRLIRSVMPDAWLTTPPTAKPWPFSINACPYSKATRLRGFPM